MDCIRNNYYIRKKRYPCGKFPHPPRRGEKSWINKTRFTTNLLEVTSFDEQQLFWQLLSKDDFKDYSYHARKQLEKHMDKQKVPVGRAYQES